MSGIRSSMRPLAPWLAVIAGAAAIAALACGGADVAPATPDDVETRGERQDYEDATDEERSSWRWEGRRQDCFFVHDNECFSYRDEACAAAGCNEDVCTHDDSAPANVSCPED